MPRFDLPVHELRTYRPTVAEPADFDDFWQTTLAESRALAEPPTLTRVDSPLSSFEVYDVAFSGFGGDRIGGWFIVPAGAEGHRLCTVRCAAPQAARPIACEQRLEEKGLPYPSAPEPNEPTQHSGITTQAVASKGRSTRCPARSGVI